MRLGRRLAVAVPLLATLVVVAALAVPVIKLTVQQLGAGYSDIVSPVSDAWVNFVFKIVDGRIVLSAVQIKFDKNLPAGSYVRVELRDSHDNVLAAGETTLNTTLVAGSWLTIQIKPSLGIYDILKFSRIVVLVAGPRVSS